MNDKKSRVNGLRVIGGILVLFGIAATISGVGLSNLIIMIFGSAMTVFGLFLLVGADSLISAIIAKQEGNQDLPSFKTSETDVLEKELQKLIEMKDKGLIDETEFKELKKKLISK